MAPAPKLLAVVTGVLVIAGVLTMNGEQPQAKSAPEPGVQHQAGRCAECRVELQKIVTLGASDGPGAFPATPGPFAMDGRGRYYAVMSDRSGELPYVFSPDGRLLARLGTEGEGPGEYMKPRLIDVDSEGNVIIWDQRLGRLTVLDEDYGLVDEARLPYNLWDIEPISGGGDILVSGRIRSRDLIGKAIHRFDRNGEHVGSWDEFDESPLVARYSRFLAPGQVGFWGVSDLHEYTITKWTSEGSELQRIERRPDWFQPYEALTPITPDIPPQPAIRGIWEDPEGLVWTIAMREDPEWPDGLGERVVSETGEEDYVVEDLDDVYDGEIEVIDPRSGDLLVGARVDRLTTWVVAPGVIAFVREDEVGWWYADLFRVALVHHKP